MYDMMTSVGSLPFNDFIGHPRTANFLDAAEWCEDGAWEELEIVADEILETHFIDLYRDYHCSLQLQPSPDTVSLLSRATIHLQLTDTLLPF